MFEYIAYLKYLDEKLSGYFKSQDPYIFCKKGCSKCCEVGDFPYKQIEVQYLLEGFNKLPDSKKIVIKNNIKKIKQQRQNGSDNNSMYNCPFLIDHECSVYEYRGIICRTFGLISYKEEGNSKVPFCAFEGLNYSNVLDEENEIISEEKFLALNTDIEPLAYNVSYKYLTSEKYENACGFKFGEMRSLIDWLE